MPPTTPEFQPRRFRSTVPYYARYRLGYPERLTRAVADICALEAGETVLDLGCGPGLLALPFARLGARVVAVDPEPEMMAAGRTAAAEAGLAIEFREGSSFSLPADLGSVKLVTMGRSFHWMDRAATLEVLDRLVAPGGALALFGESHPRTRENRWGRVAAEVSDRYGADRELHRVIRRSPDSRSHESYLFDSAFCDLVGTSVFVRHSLTVDDIIGRVLSQSISSSEKLGDRLGPFETELRAALAELSPDGHFTEIADIRATIARRP